MVERCLAFGKGSEAGAGRLGESLPIVWQDKQPTFKEKKQFKILCGSGSVGRALPCQGKGRGFEPRLPLHEILEQGIFLISENG